MVEEIKQTYKDFADLSFLLMEHKAFLEAIKTGDTFHAQNIIRDHIRIIKEKMARSVARHEMTVQ